MVVTLAFGGQFNAVEHAVGNAAHQEREAIPLPLLHSGMHTTPPRCPADFNGQHGREINLEALHLLRILWVGKYVRPTPFLIGGPY